METKLQDQAWVSLPENFKKEARRLYCKGLIINGTDGADRPIRHAPVLLSVLFGDHNLTAEPDTKNGTMDDTKRTKETELNLCELLKGCEGMEFYSPICGKCEFEKFDKNCFGQDLIFVNGDDILYAFFPNGTYADGGELMLFPSKDCRTWDGWQPPKKRWKPKDGEDYYYIDPNGNVESCCTYDEGTFSFNNYFRTSEQAEEAAKRIRELLEKYHDEIGE